MSSDRPIASIEPVSLGPTGSGAGSFARELCSRALPASVPRGADDTPAIDRVIAWVQASGGSAPFAGSGDTRGLWEGLATAAAIDVGLGRALEPHVDARAILAQADAHPGSPHDATWGVFAAEGPDGRLEAHRTGEQWRLSGVKPWCSLAGSLTHALVTAWVDRDRRGLFAVDLRAAGVTRRDGPWVSRGLDWIVSAPVEFDDVSAIPVGEPGWYLTRPGFAWGGIAVAATWWGAALPLAARLREVAGTERADQAAFAAAGEVDARLWAARAALCEAAEIIDRADGEGVRLSEGSHRDRTERESAALLAARVRAIVVDAVERTLDLAERTQGPAPLAVDEAYARRIADLRIYVRQDHGVRDLARLGRMVAR